MNKVFLIDIDGTICDDIKNEESHLYSTANDVILENYQSHPKIYFPLSN